MHVMWYPVFTCTVIVYSHHNVVTTEIQSLPVYTHTCMYVQEYILYLRTYVLDTINMYHSNTYFRMNFDYETHCINTP